MSDRPEDRRVIVTCPDCNWTGPTSCRCGSCWAVVVTEDEGK